MSEIDFLTSYDKPAPSKDERVVAVVGPTAVGKTALSERLALAMNGEIISADSMQIYRGMDIGTAKPPMEHRAVPYHCIDLVDPGHAFSAAMFQQVARTAIEQVLLRGHVPIVTGGTGLYVRAALDRMEFPPGEQGGSTSRSRYEELARDRGSEHMYGLLVGGDPASAALIHPNNVRRVIRALEMLDEGSSYAKQHAGFSVRESVYDVSLVGLTMNRELLYARIDQRVDLMMAQGLLDEVRTLLGEGLRVILTAAQAIGYKELVPVIEGRTGLEEAVASIKQASRRYAKRQLTWFRADPRIVWIDVTELSIEEVTQQALSAIDWS